MLILDFILISLALVLLIPAAILLLEVLAAILKTSALDKNIAKQQRLSVVVLMPAHNESLVITKSIESILQQLETQDRLLVVADNCADDTAELARNLGATVIERSNLQLRGKGYALDYGLQYLKNDPPEIVLIVDADCIVADNTIQLLAKACNLYQRPIQALYIMESLPNPSLKGRISEFAWLVKNKVRPMGSKAFGLPCQLMGTGMAFLWRDINKISLASGHLVEDMKLGIDLARINRAPIFLPGALVTSFFPPTQEAANTQRARWEHGHLSVILNEAPNLFLEAIRHKNAQMFGLACDLIVPPLAVLVLVSGILLALCALFGSKFTFLLSMALVIALSLAIFLAWLFFGRHIISFAQLCFAPVYALIKIPLYLKFFFNRQVEWVRSKRD